MRPNIPVRCLPVLVALLLTAFMPGCACLRNWFGGAPAGPVTCVIPEDATSHDIIVQLNENSHKLRGWRTTRAKIATRGNMLIPKVDAKIFIESRRNFRLVAESPMGREVDLGSNSDQFWFWVRRNEDHQVVVAKHDLDPEQMRRFPFPFQPDWIMETMGVVEADPDEELTVEPGPPGSYLVTLIGNRASPQGYKIRKVTVVNRVTGVVREHSLWDAHGQLIARAVIPSYVRDQASQAWVPSQIELDWPQAKVGLTMTLWDIEVNPARFAADTWKLPPFEGYKVLDLNN